MFKDKYLRQMLYGNHNPLEKYARVDSRCFTIKFPKKEDGDIVRQIRFAADDGLILYFLKRIEKLEDKIKSIK